MCLDWLSPAPGARSTRGPHGQADPGRVSLCKDARALANPWEHNCKTLMSECVRVPLISAGTGFSVGGSDAAELRAGSRQQATGRARRWRKQARCVPSPKAVVPRGLVWDAEHHPFYPCSSTSGLCTAWDPRAVPTILVVFLIGGSGVKYGMGEQMGGKDGLGSSPQPLAGRGQHRQGKLLGGAATEGMQNPCVEAEGNCAQGDLGHKSDNITRSGCWLPGPRCSVDSQGEPLIPAAAARERAVPVNVAGGLAGLRAPALPCRWRRGAGSRQRPSRGSDFSD